MRAKVVSITSLSMCFLLALALWQSERETSMEGIMEKQLSAARHAATEHKMQVDLMQARFEDFRQEVAMEIPGDKFLNGQARLRDLASVIPHTIDLSPREDALSRKNLKIALDLHEQKKYDDSTKAFLDVVSQYPESSAALEASYYLVKSFYLTGNKQESVAWANKMLKQFPDSLWTAKAMVVAADIYREQPEGRNNAIEIYHMLINTFDSPELKTEIKSRMAEMGLQ